MPRFRPTTLLIAFTAAALWLSTFASYSAADDVRSFVLLAIGVAAGAEAIYSAGARRAFWGGFFAAYLLMNSRSTFNNFSPRFNWPSRVSIDLSMHFAKGPQMKHLMEHFQATFFLVGTLTMATAIGMLCVHICRRHNRSPE